MFNLRRLQKNKTVRYGVPMLLLVVGGSFGLREFTQIRYDAQKFRRRLDPSLEAKVNVERQSVVLEEEYEVRKVVMSGSCCFCDVTAVVQHGPTRKIKEKNLDEWKNIRGPRPWEDSRDFQEQQRSRAN